MIGAYRRRTDKINSERVFLTDNAADFPAGSPVAVISETIDARMTEALERDADLTSALGDKAQALEIKEDSRDELLDEIEDVVMGAIAVGDDEVPGITAKFKNPHPRTEQNIIASADSIRADAGPYRIKLIEAGVKPDFLERILNARNAFQQARDAAASAIEGHAEAVGALAAIFREIMALARRRDAMVKLKYKNNPGKLAAWKVASHLERAPKRNDNPPPTT